MPKPLIDVAAGLITRADGSLLLAQRPGDKPWSGWWELPGGKIEHGETVLQALSRELREELDIEVTKATPWVTYTHDYKERWVRLAFCRVTAWNGKAIGAEGQQLVWVDPHQPIAVGPLLPATEPPLRWLQIPDHYLISSIGQAEGLPAFLQKLQNRLGSSGSGVNQSGKNRSGNNQFLVQFREPAWARSAPSDEVFAGFQEVLKCCRRFGVQCLINSVHPQSWRAEADGVHFRAVDFAQCAGRVPGRLTGMSAHTAADLEMARARGADFAVLGHVLATPSHPGDAAMGWAKFDALTRTAGLPVFAIGGQSGATLEQARQHGAHGIAGIRNL